MKIKQLWNAMWNPEPRDMLWDGRMKWQYWMIAAYVGLAIVLCVLSDDPYPFLAFVFGWQFAWIGVVRASRPVSK